MPTKVTWNMTCRMCKDYGEDLIMGQSESARILERYLLRVFGNEWGAPPSEVFEALLGTFFLTDRTVFPSNLPTSKCITVALSNSACPSHLLATAACNNRFDYQNAAQHNPSCPAEYEVYEALWKASHDFA